MDKSMATIRIEQLADILQGLKYYEWCKIKVAVDKRYVSMSSKLELNDIEALKKLLQIELD